ncbi:hypothetical protein B0H19DRAFT_1063511 [Mycena capillaripes]|nr:hypothetical protein B0H19DRAFT_1063511 [Mycena capillaripes]
MVYGATLCFPDVLDEIRCSMDAIALTGGVSRLMHLNCNEHVLLKIKGQLDDAYRDFLAASALRLEVKQAEMAALQVQLAAQQKQLEVQQATTHREVGKIFATTDALALNQFNSWICDYAKYVGPGYFLEEFTRPHSSCGREPGMLFLNAHMLLARLRAQGTPHGWFLSVSFVQVPVAPVISSLDPAGLGYIRVIYPSLAGANAHITGASINSEHLQCVRAMRQKLREAGRLSQRWNRLKGE